MRTIKDKITWLNIVNPNKSDIEFLRAQFNFHPIILDEVLGASARSRVEVYDDYIFMVYYLPIYEPTLKTSRKAEIDFLITAHTVITIHYEELEPLESFKGLLNSNTEFFTQALGQSSAVCLYYLIESIINFSLRQLRHIEENISSVSKEIFRGREHKLLERISYIKRDVLDYRLISRPQNILLHSLRRVSDKFWGTKTNVYFDDLIGDNLKVEQHIENYLDVVQSLEDTNAQLLNVKINRTMQVFTVLAFFTFPLVLFTSVYAIDNRTYDFWSGFLVVAAITVLLSFLLLKKK